MEEPLAQANTRENLAKLLDELGEHPDRLADVTERIQEVLAKSEP